MDFILILGFHMLFDVYQEIISRLSLSFLTAEKKMISLFFILIGITTSSIHPLQAQTTPDEIPLIIQSATITPSHAPAEKQRVLQLELSLKPGFKAYVDKFSLNILEPYPVIHGSLNLSPTHTFFDKFSKTNKIGVMDKSILKTTIEIQKPLSEGAHNFIFELKFQACSETVCFFPQVIKQEVEFHAISTEKTKPTDSRPKSLLEENFASAQKRGLPFLFIFVFLAGVLTSLTPCLLPMLPITIAVLGKGHSHDSKLKKFINSLTYVLGIAITYSLLGLLAASSGSLFGNILSNIWTQIGFGVAFIAMGLAQFGLFEFQTPLWLQNRFHKLGQGSGGILVSGLISGLIASPCVGPVLVGILTLIAQTQDHLLGFGLMFTYAMGLGQLLIILGVSTTLLYRFPKSPWIMKTSKTILGLALIASGLFYLSLLWPKQNGVFKGPVDSDKITSSQSLLKWNDYSEELLQQAKKEHKPVLIDFFADWCLACHELDEKTFTNEEIQSLLQKFILIRFDSTNDSEQLDQLRKKYGIVGLPTIIFYDSNGEWIKDITLNEFEPPEKFKERLMQIK